MIFLSTRGSKPKSGLEALFNPTKIGLNGLYVPAAIPNLHINFKDTDEQLFIKLFNLYCNDFLKKEELSIIYNAVIAQFKDNKLYNIKETARGKFLEMTNGKSFSIDDVPFVIIKEMLKLLSKRERRDVRIINLENINSHISLINNFSDTDFKICSVFSDQDLTNFHNYQISQHKDSKNIATAKIKIDKFMSIRDDIYHQSYLNDYYSFTTIKDCNFFYILSFVYILALIYKNSEGNLFSVAMPSENMSFALAVMIAKEMGIGIKRCNISFYKNPFFHRILDTGEMKKENQRNSDKWFEISRICQYPINLERILFIAYDFDNSSLLRAMESFENYNSYIINRNAVNKISESFESTLIENSFDVLNQISNLAREYNLYIEQNTSLGFLAGDKLMQSLRANEIVLNLSSVHYETCQEVLKDVLGFNIQSNKPWNESNFSIDPPQITEINDDTTDVARFISDFFDK